MDVARDGVRIGRHEEEGRNGGYREEREEDREIGPEERERNKEKEKERERDKKRSGIYASDKAKDLF